MSLKDRVHKKRVQAKPKKKIVGQPVTPPDSAKPKKKPKKRPESDTVSLVDVKLHIENRALEDSLYCELRTPDGKRLTAFRVSPDDVKYGRPWMHHSPFQDFFAFMKEHL